MAKITRPEQDYIVTKDGEKIQLAHCIELEVEPGYLGFEGSFTPTGILGVLDGGKRIIVTATENNQEVQGVNCYVCGTPAQPFQWSVKGCRSGWIHCCSWECLDKLKRRFPQQNCSGGCLVGL